MYHLLKFLHILAAMVAIGGASTFGIWLAQAKAKSDTLAFVLRGIILIDLRVTSIAYVLLVVTGVGLGHAGGFPLASPWLLLSYALLLALLGVDHGLMLPATRKTIALLDAGKFGSAEHLAMAKRTAIGGFVWMLLALALVYAMVFKPVF